MRARCLKPPPLRRGRPCLLPTALRARGTPDRPFAGSATRPPPSAPVTRLRSPRTRCETPARAPFAREQMRGPTCARSKPNCAERPWLCGQGGYDGREHDVKRQAKAAFGFRPNSADVMTARNGYTKPPAREVNDGLK